MSHIVMKQVLEQLHLTPRLTCRDLAQRTGFKPGELIDTLRRAVLDGVLAELNGFYALGSPTTSPALAIPGWKVGCCPIGLRGWLPAQKAVSRFAW